MLNPSRTPNKKCTSHSTLLRKTRSWRGGGKHNQSESLPLVLQPGFCWCPNTSTPTQTWLGMPQNKFHFRLHCVPSKIAIYLLHTSTVIQTTTSIQHLTKREVILALPGWPLINFFLTV